MKSKIFFFYTRISPVLPYPYSVARSLGMFTRSESHTKQGYFLFLSARISCCLFTESETAEL